METYFKWQLYKELIGIVLLLVVLVITFNVILIITIVSWIKDKFDNWRK